MESLCHNRRIILFLLLFTLIVNNGFSQSKSINNPIRVQPFEASFLLGGTYPLSDCMNLSPSFNIGWGLETRYNLPLKPLSFGLLFEQTVAAYNKNATYTKDETNRTTIIALSGDWNFGQGKKINPFVGLASGISSLDLSEYENVDESSYYPVFIPRVGLEFGYHLRTQLDFVIVRKGFSNVFLSIGATIGGRLKK